MEPVALDPGNYDGNYKLVGEEISFDFINTISWRGLEKEHDWLHHPANFINWAKASGIIDERRARIFSKRSNLELKRQLSLVRIIRNDLYKVLHPLAFGNKPPVAAFTRLNILIHKVAKHRHIDASSCQWVWDDPLSFTGILAPVIWNAADVVTGSDHLRIGHCAACNWLFYDRTRNRSRRWCDMDDCGSRDKSLRYYHRQKD